MTNSLPNRLRKIMKHSHFALVLVLTFPPFAQAQTSDTASADALATLEAAVIPLQVDGADSLDFGSLRIPNGLVAGNTCSYYSGAGNTATTALREFNSAGSVVDQSFPTPSGCEVSGTAQSAKFDVTCSAATPTQFSVSWTSAGNTGVTFRETILSGLRLLAAYPDGGNASSLLQDSRSSTMTLTCPNNGALDIYVGGEVVLESTASAASQLTVGTVTLSANY